MLSREKFRSAGFGAAMLVGVFLSSAADAQDHGSENPEREQSTIRMTLPNLTTHPLAGGTVLQRLCAEDGMGERSCDDVEVYIPPPALENPIGQMLHALRRDLAVDDLNSAPGVIGAIQEILDTQAESFDNPESLIRLNEIQQDIAGGVETQDISVLDTAIQDLWRLILQLEDDLRSEAEKALEEAQEALQEALENGASEEELKELREKAQEALEEFLKEQLDNAEENEMSPEEKAALEEMAELMKKMEEMKEEMGLSEEQMAEMMEQMMEQAQQAQQGQPGESGEPQEMDYQKMLEQMQQKMQQMQQMMENMDELKELIEEQQELRDETFEDALEEEEPSEDQQKPPEPEPQEQKPGEPGAEQPPQKAEESLSDQQNELNQRLDELMEKMRKEGMGPGELQRAQEAMRRAQRDLQDGKEGQAVPDQDEALEAMNAAQQQMQQQMQQMMKPGAGPQSGQGPGGPAAARPQDVPGVDNEGRISEADNPNDMLGVTPGEGSEAQRSVRDQIRRRIEREGSKYLEDLLNGDEGPSAPGQ